MPDDRGFDDEVSLLGFVETREVTDLFDVGFDGLRVVNGDTEDVSVAEE